MAGLVEERAVQRLGHREGDEEHQQHRATHYRRRDEQVPLEEATPRHPCRADHHQRQQRHESADTDAELVARQLAEQRREDRQRPALGTDQEATGKQPAKADQTACQEPASLRLACGQRQADAGDRHAQQAHKQPAAPVHHRLQQPVGGFRAAQHLRQHAVPRSVLDRIPGQHQIGQQADAEPERDRPVGAAVHRATRRFSVAGN